MKHQVPVLDLSRFDVAKCSLVAEAGKAYREYGFCGFTNHGISESDIADGYDAFRNFFALPACISEENPDRYPVSITANDFLVERLREIKLM